jgi:hypothetical protein
MYFGFIGTLRQRSDSMECTGGIIATALSLVNRSNWKGIVAEEVYGLDGDQDKKGPVHARGILKGGTSFPL